MPAKPLPPALWDRKSVKFTRFNKEKHQILDLFEEGRITTLSEAAHILDLSKYAVYHWAFRDVDFGEALKIAKEIVADRIEVQLLECDKMAQVTARIFLLNGLRPGIYKGTKIEVDSPKLQKLLTDIREAGKANEPKALPPPSDGDELRTDSPEAE
jgi:hypothetical protein